MLADSKLPSFHWLILSECHSCNSLELPRVKILNYERHEIINITKTISSQSTLHTPASQLLEAFPSHWNTCLGRALFILETGNSSVSDECWSRAEIQATHIKRKIMMQGLVIMSWFATLLSLSCWIGKHYWPFSNVLDFLFIFCVGLGFHNYYT